MSDTFGALYISGIQTGLPGGGVQGIGPFAIPCSGDQYTQTWVVDTTATVPVPTVTIPKGVLLVPPTGGTVAWGFKTYSSDIGTQLSVGYPTFIDFDTANPPTNLYLFSSGSVPIVVQFI